MPACSSAATTVESTPPDTPQITPAVPIRSRNVRAWTSMNSSIVQRAVQACHSGQEVRQDARAVLGVHDLGMELEAVPDRAPGWRTAANGLLRDVPSTSNSSGSRVTESP